MNYLDSLKFNKSKNTAGIELKSQAVNVFRFHQPFQANRLPLMPVPGKLWFVCENSRITFPTAIKHRRPQPTASERFKLPDKIEYEAVVIKVPKVDEIGTAYVKEQLPVIYTLRAMRFDSERSGYKSSSSESDKVGISYGLDILKAIQKESAGEINVEYEKQWQKAFSFYINQANVHQLEEESRKLNEKYYQIISEVEYFYTEKPGVLGTLRKIGDETAGDFMIDFNALIADAVDNYFKNLTTQMQPFEKLKK